MSELAVAAAAHDIIEMGRILGSLLAVAEIRQLVVVDDSYADEGIDTDVIVAAAQAAPTKFAELIPALGNLEGDELAHVSTRVRQALEEDTELAERVWKVYQADNDEYVELDNETRSALDRLVHAIPEDAPVRFLKLSGDDWQSRADPLLDPANGGTLVLVDRDFTREGRSPDHGLTVIVELIKGGSDDVYCALLSHKVDPGNELDQWRDLAEQHGIPQHKFVVISKRRLAEGQPDLAGFLHLLRLAILCGPLQELRDKVHKHFETAAKTTHDDLDKWSVFDFDEAVFGSSRNEGIWEGETLLRVMTTFTIRTARTGVFGDTDVRKLINLARRASAVQIPDDELHPWKSVGRMALEYQRTELYSYSEYVNAHHLPLEAGDMFDRGDGKKEYIMLAQPCDLMVRATGRAYDSGLCRMVPLCSIKDVPAKDEGQSYELPCWRDKGRQSGFVHFSRVHLVRIAILDLCVLRGDGKAVFDNSRTLPEALSEVWRQYAGKLLKQLEKERAQAYQLRSLFLDAKNNIPKKLRKLAEAKIIPCCSNTGRFKVKPDQQGFTVNLRRIRRVNPSRASDILRAFARHQSRAAFDRSVVTESLRRRMAKSAGGDDAGNSPYDAGEGDPVE